MFTKTFDQAGDFVAYEAAVRWLKAQGYSVGSMQREAPVGIMAGDWNIAKWRNLSGKERSELDGVIIGDSKRAGPVTIHLHRTPQSRRHELCCGRHVSNEPPR